MEAVAKDRKHASASRHRARIAVLGTTSAIVLGTLAAFVLTQNRSKRTSPAVVFGLPERVAQSDDHQLDITMLRDGRYLRLERGTVTVIEADGLHSRALTTPSGLAPAKIRPAAAAGWAEVYATGAPCSWWLVPLDGGTWRSLLDDPSCASRVDLSPDGAQLAIIRGGELRVRHLATGVERILLNTDGAAADIGRGPSWSPDGKRLVVDRGIVVMDLESGVEIHHGDVGSNACWLDADQIVYVIRTWLHSENHSEIHLLNLRTGTDRIVLEMKRAIWELAAQNGGLLVRRDELHGQTYLAAVTQEYPMSVEQLTPLDTGSTIDFLPSVWTSDGATITLSIVAGQRGLVRTVLGQQGTPLVLHPINNIILIGNTDQHIIYSFNDDDNDCQIRVFDLGTRKDHLWRSAHCTHLPYVTCARSPSRCLVVDEVGSRWFSPSVMRFDGPAPRLEVEEVLSPDATASVRVRGTLVIRDLASGNETTIPAPSIAGSILVGWGNNSNTLIATTSAPDHHRMLVGTRDGSWRMIIDEPRRILNGYAISPDGSQIAIVALNPVSTWSYLPFSSPLRR